MSSPVTPQKKKLNKYLLGLSWVIWVGLGGWLVVTTWGVGLIVWTIVIFAALWGLFAGWRHEAKMKSQGRKGNWPY